MADEPPIRRLDPLTRLCALALDPSPFLAADPAWKNQYRIAMAFRDVAARLHLRVPRRYLKLERAVVLAGVAALSNDIPLCKVAHDRARR